MYMEVMKIFSIISKIVKSYQQNPFILFNNGDSIRDFIHVDEVCEIYKKLLKSKSNPKFIFDIARDMVIKLEI